MRYILALLLLTSCSAAKPATCVSQTIDKKGIVGETERNTTCRCECPVQAQSVVDAGGILGGLLSLFNKD